MDNRAAFLSGSILDIQNTIRAIDVKIGALLVGLLAPFAMFGRVWAHFMHLCQVVPSCVGVVLSLAFFSTWICSVAALVRALSALGNPGSHISNSRNCTGSFYGPGLYAFGLLDIFVNRSSIRASKDVSALILDIPKGKKRIVEELVFEQLKLIYIRDMKIFRLQAGINFAMIWMAIGIVSFLYSKFG